MRVETETLGKARARTILVLDDEPIIRRVVERALERHGYRVLVAGGPSEALTLLREHPEIDLMLADLTLAGGRSGADVVVEARALVPGLKVLYVTGHSPQTVADAVGGERPPVLQKPFTPARLREAVDTILD